MSAARRVCCTNSNSRLVPRPMLGGPYSCEGAALYSPTNLLPADNHGWAATQAEGAAAALRAGTDLACQDYSHLGWGSGGACPGPGLVWCPGCSACHAAEGGKQG